ncbi:MAG: VCBS repeat-containing protein, partial [Pyrinomonadaceae bacterium]
MSKMSALLRFGFLVSLVSISVTLFLPFVSSQNTTASDDTSKDAPASITAKGVGFPRVSFEDGKDLPAPQGAQSGSAPRSMTAADFDSDGVPDLVTVDAGGAVRIYQGNVDSIFPNNTGVETRKAAGSFVDAPFYASRGAFSLPAAPDYLESGDFNADGHADLLTASNGGSSLYVSAGDGKGNFIHTTEFTLPGSITALAVGEIGR